MLTPYEHSVIGDMNSKAYLRLCIILLCFNYVILKPLTPTLCKKKKFSVLLSATKVEISVNGS